MVNKVILIGRVGKSPEIRYFDSNSVANFSLATTKTYKNKSGEKISKTEWHNCVAWGGLCGVVEKYVFKGDLLYIEGEIQYEEYEKDGVKKYATKISVFNLQMLGGKKDQAEQDQSSEPEKDSEAGDFEEDDLPF